MSEHRRVGACSLSPLRSYMTWDKSHWLPELALLVCDRGF